jgi:hypothetical protein
LKEIKRIKIMGDFKDSSKLSMRASAGPMAGPKTG